jgi:hypothetical protein
MVNNFLIHGLPVKCAVGHVGARWLEVTTRITVVGARHGFWKVGWRAVAWYSGWKGLVTVAFWRVDAGFNSSEPTGACQR